MAANPGPCGALGHARVSKPQLTACVTFQVGAPCPSNSDGNSVTLTVRAGLRQAPGCDKGNPCPGRRQGLNRHTRANWRKAALLRRFLWLPLTEGGWCGLQKLGWFHLFKGVPHFLRRRDTLHH